MGMAFPIWLSQTWRSTAQRRDRGARLVLLGKGDGTLQTPVNYPSGTNIAGIAAGDVTGDKVPDLIVTHYGA